MLTHKQRAWVSASIIVAALLLIVIAVWFSPIREIFSSAEHLRDVVQDFGWLGPVIIILIHVLQVIVAPIPGQAIDIANGYLFGWLWGSVISLIGIAIGTIIAIWLAKRFGRPLVETLITRKGMQQIKPYTHRRSQLLFFFLFLLPGTPDDILCFAIGLTTIPLWRAVMIAILGRIPGVMAAVITGSTGQSLNPLMFTLVAFGLSVVVGWIVWKTPLAKKMKLPPETKPN